METHPPVLQRIRTEQDIFLTVGLTLLEGLPPSNLNCINPNPNNCILGMTDKKEEKGKQKNQNKSPCFDASEKPLTH